jgi:hypothetical protein
MIGRHGVCGLRYLTFWWRGKPLRHLERRNTTPPIPLVGQAGLFARARGNQLRMLLLLKRLTDARNDLISGSR